MFSKSLQITVAPGAREGTRILHLNGPLNMETTLEFQRVVRAESSPVLIVDFGGGPAMRPAIRNTFEPLAAVPAPNDNALGMFVMEPDRGRMVSRANFLGKEQQQQPWLNELRRPQPRNRP